MQGRVYILLLNWNGWRDTIECLESVFRLDYPDYRVVVCDNASEDDSIACIKDWAQGHLDAEVGVDNPLRGLSNPPVPKPIPWVEYDRAQAEAGGDDSSVRLVLIHTGANLGFAGGNNVGFRYALTRGDFEYVWLLNNDTVVAPDALSSLVKRVSGERGVGMCGSMLLIYGDPGKVQAYGGARYNKWLGTATQIGSRQSAEVNVDIEEVEHQLDYVVGASLLASRSFIDDIGLLCEDYFLYYEELDWAMRARGKYRLAYAHNSIVYHKQGRSTGTGHKTRDYNWLSDCYLFRNRLRLTHRFFPWALPTSFLGVLFALGGRVYRRQWRGLEAIAKASIGCRLP